ncbi:MAG: hypothetical protein AAB624_01445 [Patescibacteria group bacterium]
MAEAKKSTETTKAPVAEHAGVAVPPKKSGGNNKTLVIVLIVVFVVFILPGFVLAGSLWWWGRGDNASKLAESIIESSTGGDVDINSDDGEFSVTSDDGTYEISSSAELPENFPEGIPLYDDMDITGSSRSSSNDVSSWTVSAETGDSISQVGDFFDEEFASWDNQAEYSSNGTTTTVYKKGNLTVTVTVGEHSTDEDKTSISYIVSEDNSN